MLNSFMSSVVIGVTFIWATIAYVEDTVKNCVFCDKSGRSGDKACPGSVVKVIP